MKLQLAHYSLSLLALSILAYGQQNLDSGSVQANVYTNDSLGLTWQFPQEWITQSPSTKPQAGRSHILLDLVAGKDGSAGIVVEDFRDTPRFWAGYGDSLKEMLNKKDWDTFGQRGYRTLGDGVDAVEDHFKSRNTPVTYLAVICGGLRGYELKFMMQASTPERLDEIAKALTGVRVRADFSSGEKLELLANGSRPRRARVSESVSQSLIKRELKPEYPSEARKNKIHGSVVMLAHISAMGHVQDLYVKEGDPVLATAAVRAVSQWEYRPYLLNGEPMSVETQITVAFR